MARRRSGQRPHVARITVVIDEPEWPDVIDCLVPFLELVREGSWIRHIATTKRKRARRCVLPRSQKARHHERSFSHRSARLSVLRTLRALRGEPKPAEGPVRMARRQCGLLVGLGAVSEGSVGAFDRVAFVVAAVASSGPHACVATTSLASSAHVVLGSDFCRTKNCESVG